MATPEIAACKQIIEKMDEYMRQMMNAHQAQMQERSKQLREFMLRMFPDGPVTAEPFPPHERIVLPLPERAPKPAPVFDLPALEKWMSDRMGYTQGTQTCYLSILKNRFVPLMEEIAPGETCVARFVRDHYVELVERFKATCYGAFSWGTLHSNVKALLNCIDTRNPPAQAIVGVAALQTLHALAQELQVKMEVEKAERKVPGVPNLAEFRAHVDATFAPETRENLLLKLYLEWPMRDDVPGLLIFESEHPELTDTNYIIVPFAESEPVQLRLNEFKTDARKDRYITLSSLSPELSAQIRAVMRTEGLKYGGQLFDKTKHGRKWAEKVTAAVGIQQGTFNTLRKTVASNMREAVQRGDATAEDEADLILRMCHSAEAHLRTYVVPVISLQDFLAQEEKHRATRKEPKRVMKRPLEE